MNLTLSYMPWSCSRDVGMERCSWLLTCRITVGTTAVVDGGKKWAWCKLLADDCVSRVGFSFTVVSDQGMNGVEGRKKSMRANACLVGEHVRRSVTVGGCPGRMRKCSLLIVDGELPGIMRRDNTGTGCGFALQANERTSVSSHGHGCCSDDCFLRFWLAEFLLHLPNALRLAPI